jgi:hypothetical protein
MLHIGRDFGKRRQNPESRGISALHTDLTFILFLAGEGDRADWLLTKLPDRDEVPHLFFS